MAAKTDVHKGEYPQCGQLIYNTLSSYLKDVEDIGAKTPTVDEGKPKKILQFLKELDHELKMHLLVNFQMHYKCSFKMEPTSKNLKFLSLEDKDMTQFKEDAPPHFLNILIQVNVEKSDVPSKSKSYYGLMCFHSWKADDSERNDAVQYDNLYRLAYAHIPNGLKEKKSDIYQGVVDECNKNDNIKMEVGLPLEHVNIKFDMIAIMYPFCRMAQSNFGKIHETKVTVDKINHAVIKVKEDIITPTTDINQESTSLHHLFHALRFIWEKRKTDATTFENNDVKDVFPAIENATYVGVMKMIERIKEPLIQVKIKDTLWKGDANKWRILSKQIKQFEASMKKGAKSGDGSASGSESDLEAEGDAVAGLAAQRTKAQESDSWLDGMQTVDRSVYIKNAIVSTILGGFVAVMFTW